MTIPIVYDRGDDEYIKNIGFNGVEVGAEGPFSKKKTASGRQASYLLNYRYSLFGLMSAIGFQIAGTPNYTPSKLVLIEN
jgi:hypothetical protein